MRWALPSPSLRVETDQSSVASHHDDGFLPRPWSCLTKRLTAYRGKLHSLLPPRRRYRPTQRPHCISHLQVVWSFRSTRCRQENVERLKERKTERNKKRQRTTRSLTDVAIPFAQPHPHTHIHSTAETTGTCTKQRRWARTHRHLVDTGGPRANWIPSRPPTSTMGPMRRGSTRMMRGDGASPRFVLLSLFSSGADGEDSVRGGTRRSRRMGSMGQLRAGVGRGGPGDVMDRAERRTWKRLR